MKSAKMRVTLVDSMGDDLSVVNAARVSFDKEHITIDSRDEKLIKYLAEHNHWSPFGHASLQFRIKAPVFVARQLVKHQVGLVWNEVSRRYVDNEPEFYIPDFWRTRPQGNIKQGSGEDRIEYDIAGTMEYVKQTYDNLLKEGVAPEMARMVLPQNMMTEWFWSGTLYAFARVCNLRLHKTAQIETQIIAEFISDNIKEKFPLSWKSLIGEGHAK